MNKIDATKIEAALAATTDPLAIEIIKEATLSALSGPKSASEEVLEYLDSLGTSVVTSVSDNTDPKKLNHPAIQTYLAGSTNVEFKDLLKSVIVKYNNGDCNQNANGFLDSLGLLV